MQPSAKVTRVGGGGGGQGLATIALPTPSAQMAGAHGTAGAAGVRGARRRAAVGTTGGGGERLASPTINSASSSRCLGVKVENKGATVSPSPTGKGEPLCHFQAS